jgi:hypothetical protein
MRYRIPGRTLPLHWMRSRVRCPQLCHMSQSKENFVCDAYGCSKQSTFLPSDARRNDQIDDTTIEPHSLPDRNILFTVTLVALAEIKVERMCTLGEMRLLFGSQRNTSSDRIEILILIMGSKTVINPKVAYRSAPVADSPTNSKASTRWGQ